MKNMKTWLSALLAVMMLLAMTGIAMADTVPTGSITVENLEPGETVTIYQVIEIESDGTAALKDPKWVSRVQDWIATEYPEYADAANLPADGSTGVSKSTFYNALSGQLASSLTAVKNEQVSAATYMVENLPIGSYMVLVMGGEKAHEAYLTSIRATRYDFDNAEWVVEDGVVNAAAKCKTPDVKKEEDKTTAAIGDKVTFTVDSDVPTYPASAYDVAYELEDTMAEGLTFNGDLKAYGINATGKTELTPGTEFKADYTQSTTDGKTKIFKLKFDYSLIKDYTQIELVYSATVNEKIKIGSDQNINEVKFTYDQKEKSSYTVLYSFGFDLTKRADSETGELLAGAEFELRQDGEALKFKKLSDGHYAVDPAGETKLVTGKEGEMKGKIIIDGLNVGAYKLKETKAPDNFNLMQGEKDVTIEQNSDAQEKHLLANTNDPKNSKSAYWYQTVVDKRISGLPATGGMGTTIFMVAGIAVMACAVVALMVVLKRQKRSEG